MQTASVVIDRRQNVFENAVVLMDTGEHVTVGYVATPIVVELAKQLYSDANVSVNVVDTGIVADSALQAFISEHVGRIEPWSDTAVTQLHDDLSQTVAWWEIKQRRARLEKRAKEDEAAAAAADEAWATSELPQSTRRIRTVGYDIRAPPAALEEAPADVAAADAFDHVDCAPVGKPADVDQDMFLAGACAAREHPANTHVVYNKLLHLTFVVDAVGSKAVYMCQQLPDFELVHSLMLHDDDHKTSCRALFHAKLCNGVQRAKDRMAALVTLFELDDDVAGAVPGTEKDNVAQILRTAYAITSDPVQRMPAAVLMNQMCEALHVFALSEVRSLNQRLPAYFLEAGLQKKRTAQGYVYYGIRRVEQADFGKAQNIEALESLREDDLARFRSERGNQDPNDIATNPTREAVVRKFLEGRNGLDI